MINSNSCGSCGGGGSPNVSPLPPPSPSVTRSVTVTPTPMASNTPSITPTRTVTITPSTSNSPTRSPYASATPVITIAVASVTPTITPTMTPTSSNVVSRTPNRTVTPTVSLTKTPYPSETPRPTKAPTAETTPTASRTPTLTPSSTRIVVSNTPTRTATPTRSAGVTSTPSVSQTNTPSITPTRSATPTATSAITVSPSVSVSATPGVSPSNTPTVTPTRSATPSATLGATPSTTVSITPSISSSAPAATIPVTPTITPTTTVSISATPTVTATITPSVSVSGTPQQTPDASASATPSPTASNTITPTTTPSATPFATPNPSAIAPLELNVSGVPQTGRVGQNYSGSLTATGGNGSYTYSIWSGTLPSGLTLNTATGLISGIPDTSGAYEVGVSVTSAGTSDPELITITISEAITPTPTPSATTSLTPTPTPSQSASEVVPEDTNLVYVSSGVEDDVPSQQNRRMNARAVNDDGFIHDGKLMIRNSYFMIGEDESGNDIEIPSKVITLDDVDNVDTYTVALYTADGYDMRRIGYIEGNPDDDVINSNLSFMPYANNLILVRSNTTTNQIFLDMWNLNEDGGLDWTNAAAGDTIPPPTRTLDITSQASNIDGPVHRIYVDKVNNDVGTLYDRLYLLTKDLSTAAGETLVSSLIGYEEEDGSFTFNAAQTQYISTAANEFVGSSSQPPNPNFTVIFTINSSENITSKIIAQRLESFSDSPFIVADVESSNIPDLNHITTSADYTHMLGSSLELNVIYKFDPYTLEYDGVYGESSNGNPTTVVNYDYIRMNIIPTNSHYIWDGSSTQPWSKLNILNYDEENMDMTYLHYDIHRSILRSQSWKYENGVVVGTYIGFIGIKSVIPVLPTPTPTSSPLSSPTATPTMTPSPTPSVTASHTAAVTPTVSTSPSETPAVTPTVTPSVTPSITLSVTPSITQSVTPSVTITPSVYVTPTPSSSPIPTLTIDSSDVPNEGMEHITFEGRVYAHGGPNSGYIFTVSSDKPLPNGLVINSETGVVSGVPTVVGTYTVGFEVESTPYTAQVDHVIVIEEFDASFDGMQFTTQPDEFENRLDGTIMPAEPSETYDAGTFN